MNVLYKRVRHKKGDSQKEKDLNMKRRICFYENTENIVCEEVIAQLFRRKFFIQTRDLLVQSPVVVKVTHEKQAESKEPNNRRNPLS